MTRRNPFQPARRRGTEHLDDPRLDPAIALRSLQDVATCNRLFGGTNAVIAELRPVFAAARRRAGELVLLDVGAGTGDIAARARAEAERSGVQLRTVGLEASVALASACRPHALCAVASDARALPIASKGVDVVVCSQVLHHFDDAGARALLAELDRVARVRVIVAELRRAWAAAGGVWVASFALGFHPVSRHDGVVSVLRGYRPRELHDVVVEATGQRPIVRRRPGFRVCASWSPA